MFEIAVIGGGLGGLVSACHLAQSGKRVVLFEKKNYPYHKVCGEYISNEVKPYLMSIGLDINELSVTHIQNLTVTSPNGYAVNTELDLGGFGISRYTLDKCLYDLAQRLGVQLFTNTSVEKIDFLEEKNIFEIHTSQFSIITAQYCIGAYGKRSKLDTSLNRSFVKKRTQYMAVKYHIKYPTPSQTISLHNFQDGYCGISEIENGASCLCYLTKVTNLKSHGNINEMEKNILSINPFLKDIFDKAQFIYDKPLVINEINFEPKTAIENHILMVGDTAGLISPLCGNGMAMAIHGAKIASELLVQTLANQLNRKQLEDKYTKLWQAQFARRLWVGRNVQRLFGNKTMTELALKTIKNTPFLLNWLIKNSHGEVI